MGSCRALHRGRPSCSTFPPHSALPWQGARSLQTPFCVSTPFTRTEAPDRGRAKRLASSPKRTGGRTLQLSPSRAASSGQASLFPAPPHLVVAWASPECDKCHVCLGNDEFPGCLCRVWSHAWLPWAACMGPGLLHLLAPKALGYVACFATPKIRVHQQGRPHDNPVWPRKRLNCCYAFAA